MQTLWEKQGKEITCQEIREAILNGEFNNGATVEQRLDSWRREYAKFVEEHMRSLWIEAMREGAKKVEEKISGWQFDITEPNVQLWIKQRGEQFVTNAAQTQMDGLKTVLRRAATSGMNIDELSRVIQSMVGLNWRQSLANLNRYHSAYDRLSKEGKSPRQAEKEALEKAILYGQQQHRYRGYSIAETELVSVYNRGALHAVKQAQNMCLLGTVVKRWHAFLDEKTCYICEKLHDTTIGIDEDFQYREKGVLLPINLGLKDPDSRLAPPAHLFCRRQLEFEEISPPDPATRFDEIKEIELPDGLHSEGRYDIFEKIPRDMLGDVRQYMRQDGSFDLERAKKDYEKFLDIAPPEKNRWLLWYVFETVNYRQTNNSNIIFGYHPVQDMIVYNPNNDHDFAIAMTHELGHRIDSLFVQTKKSRALSDAIARAETIFNKNPDIFIDYIEKYDKIGYLEDIISAICKNEHKYFAGHDKEYWDIPGTREGEIFANLFTIESLQDQTARELIEKYFPDLINVYQALESEASQKLESIIMGD